MVVRNTPVRSTVRHNFYVLIQFIQKTLPQRESLELILNQITTKLLLFLDCSSPPSSPFFRRVQSIISVPLVFFVFFPQQACKMTFCLHKNVHRYHLGAGFIHTLRNIFFFQLFRFRPRLLWFCTFRPRVCIRRLESVASHRRHAS